MTLLAQIDYGALGTGLAVAFIAFMQAYSAWRSKKRDEKIASSSLAVEQVANQVAAVGETVDKVHVLTNSAMGLQKKNLARVTAALATLTNDPKDQLAAIEAMNDFLSHEAQQAKVDAGVK